jgi:hypothetical protein
MADESDLRQVLTDNRSAVARQLERERHKPVDDPMTAAEARALTDRIRRTMATLWDHIVEAYYGRADIALGYDSWDDYCSTEFASTRLRIPREERRDVVYSLRESGLSIRAIASATGVSEGTVRNDLKSGAQNYAPEPEVDEDALTEQLIAGEQTSTDQSRAQNYAPDEEAERPTAFGQRVTAEPFTPRIPTITGRTVTREPVRHLQLTVVTGRDGKKYQPSRPQQPKPPPSDAELFDQELVRSSPL